MALFAAAQPFYRVPANVCSWGKSGRAADITRKTDFGPRADIGWIEIPQRSGLLAPLCVRSFGVASAPARFRTIQVCPKDDLWPELAHKLPPKKPQG